MFQIYTRQRDYSLINYPYKEDGLIKYFIYHSYNRGFWYDMLTRGFPGNYLSNRYNLWYLRSNYFFIW